MQGSLHWVWVLNRAVTVDYVWVKARNGKFSFLLMEKVSFSLLLFVSLSVISKLYFEFMSI